MTEERKPRTENARPMAGPATILFFHAHPDDEAIATGGTMALAAAAGHRVVLVVATKGEEGEVDDGFLDEGETLEERRVAETRAACEILGVDRLEFLDYRDSGMMGTPENGHTNSFWGADVDEAARRLAVILEEESADVLTVYDDHGGYGHPDHIQVHRVGHRAAQMAGTARVFEATMNREGLKQMQQDLRGADGDEDGPTDAIYDTIGTPDAEITTAVDVTSVLDVKRAAMAAHPSQISAESWFFRLPSDAFRMAFGTEWYLRTSPPFHGAIPDDRDDRLV
jgi:LmbE family N-acetylglucosaminyl deacetylase